MLPVFEPCIVHDGTQSTCGFELAMRVSRRISANQDVQPRFDRCPNTRVTLVSAQFGEAYTKQVVSVSVSTLIALPTAYAHVCSIDVTYCSSSSELLELFAM